MVRVAQLTDLHLLEPSHTTRRGLLRRRLSYLSFGRPLDAGARHGRAKRALTAAREAAVDHLVMTGDLTEDGTIHQFEALAELLSESGLPPERITLVPGNHDVYAHRSGFTAALAGPLRAYAETSTAGAVVDLGDLSIINVDTALHQHYAVSAGGLTPAHWQDVLSTTAERVKRSHTVLLAQHHPAATHRRWAMQWIDGNRDYAVQRTLLQASEAVYVVHGHVHRTTSEVLSGRARIFSASAVVDSDEPLRVYSLRPGGLVEATPDGLLASPAYA